MKRNVLKLSAFVFFLSLCVSLVAQEKKLNPKDFAGNWTFTVLDAPYGYDKGTTRLFLEGEQLKGEFKLGESTLKVNSFTEKAEGYLCTVYVDGYPIDVLLSLKEGKLTGRADTGDDYFAISFTKAE